MIIRLRWSLFLLGNRLNSSRFLKICDHCTPDPVFALRKIADWWSYSELFDSVASRESSVKLWLQLAEQTYDMNDSSPQFASVMEAITRIVRSDVLASLDGDRPVEAVPWFSTLQLCPTVTNDILFSWDEYNNRIAGADALCKLAKLPMLLSDVMPHSASMMLLLRRLFASTITQNKAAALGRLRTTKTSRHSVNLQHLQQLLSVCAVRTSHCNAPLPFVC